VSLILEYVSNVFNIPRLSLISFISITKFESSIISGLPKSLELPTCPISSPHEINKLDIDRDEIFCLSDSHFGF